jgi:hypothetical protein
MAALDGWAGVGFVEQVGTQEVRHNSWISCWSVIGKPGDQETCLGFVGLQLKLTEWINSNSIPLCRLHQKIFEYQCGLVC